MNIRGKSKKLILHFKASLGEHFDKAFFLCVNSYIPLLGKRANRRRRGCYFYRLFCKGKNVLQCIYLLLEIGFELSVGGGSKAVEVRGRTGDGFAMDAKNIVYVLVMRSIFATITSNNMTLCINMISLCIMMQRPLRSLTLTLNPPSFMGRKPCICIRTTRIVIGVVIKGVPTLQRFIVLFEDNILWDNAQHAMFRRHG